MGEWISVNDRLPEEAGYYLVYNKTWKFVDRVYFRGKSSWAKGGHHISHWMPLPNPPKVFDDVLKTVQHQCMYPPKY